MERSGRSSCLGGEVLAIGTVFDCFNAITEERRPKISSTHDFLGGGETGEVATTSAAMTGIEDLLGFSVCEATLKDNIYSTTTKVIADKKVARGLVLDTLSSITIKMKGEILGSQLSKDVTVPRVVGGDGKQMFIGKSIINGSILVLLGKSEMSSARTKPFLLFGVTNSRSNSWRITTQRAYFPLRMRRLNRKAMGLESVTTLVERMRI